MRRQDELIALYPGQESSTRKFLLAQAESFSLAFDSHDLLELLQHACTDSDPMVRHQATFSRSRFLPGHIRTRYSLTGHSPGMWSAYGTQHDLSATLAAASEAPSRAIARRRAFLHVSRKLGAALADRSSRASTELATLARLAAGQLPLLSVHEALQKRSRGGFDGCLPRAMSRDPDQGDPALDRLIRERAREEPDLCLLFDPPPGGDRTAAMLDLISVTDCLGRCNLALILPDLTQVDRRAVLEALAARREAWVTIHGLRAIEAMADVEYLPVLRDAFRRSTSRFVRSQAIRAAGAMSGQEPVDFCLEAIQGGDAPVQAQALETLVRLRCEPETLARVATPLLGSSSLRARVNAILATATQEDTLPWQLGDLILGEDAVSRLEAAYCLGYLQTRRSLEYLETFIKHDPSRAVKLQAIKSLSKYPVHLSIPRLVPLLGDDDTTISSTTSRALSRLENEEARQVVTALMERLTTVTAIGEKALLLKTAGTLSARCHIPAVEEVLDEGIESRDPVVRLAGLEGWTFRGGAGLESRQDRLRRAAMMEDPRVSARGAMASFLGGDLESMGPLSRQALEGNETTALPAVQVFLELGILMRMVEAGDRYPGLDRSLQAVAGRAGCLEDPDISHSSAFPAIRPPGEGGARPPRKVGKFKIIRDIQAVADRPPAAARLEGLAGHLGRPQVKAGAQPTLFGQTLEATTYLVDPQFEPRTLGSVLKRSPGWAILLMGLALVAPVLISRSVAGGAGALPPLSVEFVEGDVRRPDGARVVRGAEIQAGSHLQTGPGQSVRFITRWEDRISIFESSSIVVHEIGREGSLDLTVVRGLSSFQVSPPGVFRLRVADRLLVAEQAAFTIGPQGSGLALMVESGSVLSGSIQVGPGAPHPLDMIVKGGNR